jgi:hypothetical protein
LLPEGLIDRVHFRDPGRILLARSETKGGRGGPFGHFPPKDFPRVFAIRELTVPDAARTLTVIEDFNAHIHDAVLSADGTFLAVEGLSTVEGKPVRSVRIYDAVSGTLHWPIPSQQPTDNQGSHLCFDPTGRVLLACLARNVPTLLDVPARASLGQIAPTPEALGPGAGSWLTGVSASRDHPAGVAFYERGRETPLITFIEDSPGDSRARFSPDGRHVARGHRDGSVSVADLVEVQRQLSAIDLGW